MKFFWGFITGIVVTIIGFYIYTKYEENNNELVGLTLLKKKGECLTKRNLKIFQTFRPNMALAEFGEYPNKILVLLINNNGIVYYDDQKIFIPAKQCARQYGTYQYETKIGISKTVPVVIIE